MFWYSIASLIPAILLIVACLRGGPWPLFAVFSITVVVFFLDRLSRRLPTQPHTGRALSLVLAGVHFILLPLGVWALAENPILSTTDKVLIYIGLGLFFGQISNSNAHELIHASTKWPRRIGTAIYCSLLHGHHVSAHLRVHHIHVATDSDPNSARLREGFYAYALRALRGEFMAGLHADSRQRRGKRHVLTHPYVIYILGAILTLAASFALAGWRGIVAMLAVAAYAQFQLLLSDYVQHYGLRRTVKEDGKTEPVGPQHSWNAPAWYSSAMMLNAPRHSDHHMRPLRSFPALDLIPGTMPMLPRSLPVMAVLALVPPLWRRVMDRRVARWQPLSDQD